MHLGATVDYCLLSLRDVHSPPIPAVELFVQSSPFEPCQSRYREVLSFHSGDYFFRVVGSFLILRPPGASPAPTENAGEGCLEVSPAGKAGPAPPTLKLKPVFAVPGVPGVPGVDPNIPGCGAGLAPNPLEVEPNMPPGAGGAGWEGAPKPPKPVAGVGAAAAG